MTGFDNQFRTDQFIAQGQQASSAQVQHSTDQMGASLQQGSQALARMKMQMDALDADARIRAQQLEIERQSQLEKLVTMRQMHEVKLSEIGVREAELGHSIRKFEYEVRRDAMGDRNEQAEMGLRYQSELARAGYVMDPTGKEPWRKATPEEIKSLTAVDNTKDNPRLTASEARQQLSALVTKYTGLIGFEKDKVSEEDRRRMEILQGIVDNWMGYDGMPQNGAAGDMMDRPSGVGTTGPDTPANAQEAPIQEGVMQGAGVIMQTAPQFFGEQFWSGLDQKTQRGLSLSLGRGVESLIRKNGGRLDPGQAAQMVYRAFDEGGTETAYFLRSADYDDEQIRRYLTGKGRSKETIDAIIKRLDDYSEALRR